MRITFAPRGILQIDDARLTYKNFAGEASQFNREGDRNFAVVIEDQDIADALIKEGWNVKIKAPREEGGAPFMVLPVKVKFNERGPNVYIKSGDNVRVLDEDSVGILDKLSILGADLDIRPYDWEINGKTGRTAYLQAIHVTQATDRFADRYSDRFASDPDECPF